MSMGHYDPSWDKQLNDKTTGILTTLPPPPQLATIVTTKPTFLNLPLEIRNIIYDIILSTPDTCLPSPPTVSRRITRNTCDRWEKHDVSKRYVKGPFDVRKLPKWSGICALRMVCRGVYWEVERVVKSRLDNRVIMKKKNRAGSGGLWARLDVLIAPVFREREGIEKDEGDDDHVGGRVEEEEEEENDSNEELGLLSTWIHVPVAFGWLKNISVDLRLQSYRPGLFTSTVFDESDYHQVSGTIVRYFFELFCGLLGFDGRVRIQPERKWEKLEIRLVFDDDGDGNNYDSRRDEGEGEQREEADGIVETSQCELWRMEAGNELKYLFDMIYETGMLYGRLQTLSLHDGQSTVEWYIQRMMGSSDEPNVEVPALGFTDLSRVWLAMGCEEVV